MRILEIVSGTTACGATVHTLQIAAELHRRGNAITLMGKPGAWVLEQARARGVPTIESQMKRIPPRDLLAAARFVREQGIEVMLAHMSGANNFAVWLSRLTKVPAVLRAHAHTIHFHWRMAHHIIAVSEQTRRYHITHNLVPPSRISTVHGFIDPARLAVVDKGVRPLVRAELGFAPSDFLVGVIGNILPRKGQIYLVRALPAVVQRYPQVHVLLVGVTHPARYGERIRREAERLGVSRHVHWLGERKDVPRLLQAIDLYALPTLNDMLPMALLEAMWAELPILATYAGGIPEAITDGVEGWLVRPKDPDALARALIEIIENPDERARRACNAHQRVLESFSVHTQVAKIEAILAQVAERYRPKVTL
ncbi:MAG: glycosyltransferase family 4 protein [Fimbriimonadales bacterium]|nr:glycosyltransferase family 4 protein [Fimbriimonadales bacterium]MDW8051250.1 glycosyltransferase family 4 protein [Armatimonadota bacterium]